MYLYICYAIYNFFTFSTEAKSLCPSSAIITRPWEDTKKGARETNLQFCRGSSDIYYKLKAQSIVCCNSIILCRQIYY